MARRQAGAEADPCVISTEMAAEPGFADEITQVQREERRGCRTGPKEPPRAPDRG